MTCRVKSGTLPVSDAEPLYAQEFQGHQNTTTRRLLRDCDLTWGRGLRGSTKQHADPPQWVGSYMLLDYSEPDREADPVGIAIINTRHKDRGGPKMRLTFRVSKT